MKLVSYLVLVGTILLTSCGPEHHRRVVPGVRKQRALRADKREDIRDRREDVRDARRYTGPADVREDIRDRREDYWDRKWGTY